MCFDGDVVKWHVTKRTKHTYPSADMQAALACAPPQSPQHESLLLLKLSEGSGCKVTQLRPQHLTWFTEQLRWNLGQL